MNSKSDATVGIVSVEPLARSQSTIRLYVTSIVNVW